MYLLWPHLRPIELEPLGVGAKKSSLTSPTGDSDRNHSKMWHMENMYYLLNGQTAMEMQGIYQIRKYPVVQVLGI